MGKNKQSCLGGEEKANIQRDEEKQRPKIAPLFSLRYKGMLKIPALWLDPQYSESQWDFSGSWIRPFKMRAAVTQ